MHQKLSEQKIFGMWDTDSVSYLGTKTFSSSDSQSAMARFFPPDAFTGDGVGGGVISIL
jgi:hypothetical protein